jgi:hypothetical protein
MPLQKRPATSPWQRLAIVVGAATVVGACLAGWIYFSGTASIDEREEQMRVAGAQLNEARALVRNMEAELEWAKAAASAAPAPSASSPPRRD